MGVYGYERDTTPNIDKWAKNAVVFTNMRTMVPTTYPSFAMLMTGKTPFETGIHSNSTGYNGPAPGLVPLDPKFSTLAQILQENGYSTAAFINSSALDPELTNMNKGFDTYEMNIDFPLSGPNKDSRSFKNVDAAIEWMKINKNKKIFLWIHFMEPHSPYFPTKDLYCRFNEANCPILQKQADLVKVETERKKFKECQPEGIPKEKFSLIEGLYDASISSADRLIGKVLDQVTSLGLDNKSVVMLYGDHGEGFDHNYYFFHNHNLYESFIKIPFILKLPYSNSRIKVPNNLINTQIMPTLLDVLKITNNNNENDNAFSSLIDEKSKQRQKSNDYFYYINDSLSKYAIQKDSYKYIYTIRDRACLYNGYIEELYDLTEDPGETHNLVDIKIPEALELKSILIDYMKTKGLSILIENTQNLTKPIDLNKLEKLKSMGY